MNILVTGGAGYVGSVLVNKLIYSNYKVKVIDNLSFGGESILSCMCHPNFNFYYGDIISNKDLNNVLENIDVVVHLAAIVGDPACAKSPEIAKKINMDASINLYKLAKKKKVRKFIFASSCSNYGRMSDPNTYVDETSQLKPLSLYSEQKVGFEEYMLEDDNRDEINITCLRNSTIYGLSPRMRFDLTVNEFTKELALGRKLKIFGEQFWRPYCHVSDVSQLIIDVIKSKGPIGGYNIYNVGSSEENYSKKMMVDLIMERLPNSEIEYVTKDEDPRDYKVSFEKVKNQFGFQPKKKVVDGINEIISALEQNIFTDPDNTKYRNS